MRPSFDASIRGGNVMLTKAAITGLSGAASTISTGGTVTYAIAGQAYTKTALSGVATPTLDSNTGVAFLPLKTGKKCLFVFCLDSSGNLKVVQGKIVATADVVNLAAAVDFPEIPDTLTPFAYAEFAHANATDFQFGSSNWNATGLTITTPVDVVWLPVGPLTS
jgi:hypothetical protein